MPQDDHNHSNPARLNVASEPGSARAVLEGAWTLGGLERDFNHMRRRLAGLRRTGGRPVVWDLSALDALDNAGALMLWRLWGGRLPDDLRVRDEHRALFDRLDSYHLTNVRPPSPGLWQLLAQVGGRLHGGLMHAQQCGALFGELLVEFFRVAVWPLRMPWREVSANVHKIATRALAVTALVGLLIGIVVSYLLALQLRLYGAGELIVSFVGLSVVRELGPLLAAILIAGRSGSAITAELGVMRVTQEIDALKVLGISVSRRLLLPKVLAMVVALPLVVLWTSAIAVLGGMIAARLELDIGFSEFLMLLPQVVPVGSFWIGIVKGAVFGLLISVIACHFGRRVQPNTESLGRETTNAVVVSITMVILANAVFAVTLRGVGFG